VIFTICPLIRYECVGPALNGARRMANKNNLGNDHSVNTSGNIDVSMSVDIFIAASYIATILF